MLEGRLGDLVDLSGLALPIRAPDNEAFGKLNVDSSLAGVWRAACDGLQAMLPAHHHHAPHLLAYLYWRFGYETGTILRLLHHHNISWGTYEDVLGTHCNSHPNNLVLLAPVFWRVVW